MKKALSFIFTLAVLLTTHAQQSSIPSHIKTIAPGQSQALHYANSMLRSGTTTSLTLDYDSAERYYANLHQPNDSVFPAYNPFSASGQFFTWGINSNYDTSDYFTLKYAIQSYDTLINANNNFAAVPKANATITVDSFIVFLYDTNGTGSNDSVTISVFDKTLATTTGTGLNESIVTTPVWSKVYGSATNLFGAGSGNYIIPAIFYPNVTLPAGHTFGIRVDFKGDVNNAFGVAASYRNDCGTNSTIGLADFNQLAPHNSSFFVNYSTISGVYDFNANDAVAGAGSAAPCEYLPIQNFYFYPSITVTTPTDTNGIASIDAGVSNFSVYPNPSNGIFTASVHMQSTSDITTSVMDVTGTKVYESTDKNVLNLNKAIDLSSIAAGVYIVNVKTNSGSVNQRIVKN